VISTSLLERDVALRSRSRRRLYLPSVVLAGATGFVILDGTLTEARRGTLAATMASGWEELAAPAIIALVLVVLVCERLWPAERRRAFARGHVHDGSFFLLYASVVVPVMTLLSVGFAALMGHARWIEAPWTASWPRWLVVATTLVAMDACNWIAHYCDHRISTLWRFHAVHHSQEELSVLTSFRAHPFMHTTGFLLATVPVVALAGDTSLAPWLITTYVCLGTLPHANVDWSFGPVGRVVVSPAYHRVHHSLEGPFGANLGVVLVIWDVLARRAVFPERHRQVARTGLAGRPYPVEQEDGRSRGLPLLAAQLVGPFLREEQA
jgi:sterol desaturase/sphingolipid hydroxylase (fatty acid hydroxylase superfamily)